jgi:hypothetical protein
VLTVGLWYNSSHEVEEEQETVAAVEAATVDAVAVDVVRTTLAPLMHQREVLAPLLASTCLITVRSNEIIVREDQMRTSCRTY